MILKKYKYKSKTIIKYIVAYGNSQKKEMNVTKALKMLFITYGIYLAIKKKRLFKEEPQAWAYGPVFKKARRCLIRIKDLSSLSINDKQFDKLNDDADLLSLIKTVFNNFGNYSTDDLIKWCTKENSPWDICLSDSFSSYGDVIDDELIFYYFKERIQC